MIDANNRAGYLDLWRFSEAQRARLDRLGLVVLGATGLLIGIGYAIFGVRPVDSTTFWEAGQRAHYYGTTWGADAASFYVYPPPLAQILGATPWPVYLIGWTTLVFVGFWAATRWWSLPLFGATMVALLVAGFTFPPADPLVLTGIGNPQILIAAVCVIGFRYPAAWAFVLLTKIAPGIGLLWFLVRREWRSLGLALGTTAVIVTVSFVLAPGTWIDFLRFATANASAASPQPTVPIPFLVRVAMSSALIVWGARTNRRWTVPIAAGWAAIALYEWSYLTIWIAALPLSRLAPTDGTLTR